MPEQVVHTCNLDCGRVYRVCIGIRSQIYKLVFLSRH